MKISTCFGQAIRVRFVLITALIRRIAGAAGGSGYGLINSTAARALYCRVIVNLIALAFRYIVIRTLQGFPYLPRRGDLSPKHSDEENQNIIM